MSSAEPVPSSNTQPAIPKTCLVTGATGFIGSHLVERLLSLGADVRCLVRRSSSLRYLPSQGVRLVRGDLATGEGLADACRGADVIFHLAGVTKAARVSDYYRGNAAATATLLAACSDAPRLVHVSSLAAAGPSPDGKPLLACAEPRPVSHYGRSKLEAEEIVRASPLAGRTAIVRPPVVYGPRDTDVYEIFRAARRGLLLEIGGGERTFSLIYVKDLVDGLLAAACVPAAAGRTWYVANAEPLTWREFGMAAAAALGRTAHPLAVPPALAWAVGAGAEMWSSVRGKPGILSRDKIAEARCPHWVCDAGEARRELGFAASTSVRDGVAQTAAWYRHAGWLK